MRALAGWLIPALGSGLLGLRLALEYALPFAWWVWLLAAAFWAAGAAALKIRAVRVPLTLCWIYVLWPAPAPALAWGVAFVVAAAMALAGGSTTRWMRDWLPDRGLRTPCLSADLSDHLATRPVVVNALDGSCHLHCCGCCDEANQIGRAHV